MNLAVLPCSTIYRVLLTGIWLTRTGEIEANVVTLNESFRLPQILDLDARKLPGPGQSTVDNADIAFHEGDYLRLRTALQTARLTPASGSRCRVMARAGQSMPCWFWVDKKDVVLSPPPTGSP